MRANLRANAVFQRGNDFSARRVIFRVGAEDQGHIERQSHRISLNLHVTFLHDVEQSHLNFSRQVGQLVDSENAAVGTRQQSIMDGVFAGQMMAAARGLDGINIADQVGDCDIWGSELFHVALVGGKKCDGSLLAFLRNQLAAAAADGSVRIIVNFAAFDEWNLRIQQPSQRPQDAALGLAAQAQQNKVMP